MANFTVYIIDGAGNATALGTLDHTARNVQTFPVNKQIKEFSIRITGTAEEWLTVYEIVVDVESGEEQSR